MYMSTTNCNSVCTVCHLTVCSPFGYFSCLCNNQSLIPPQCVQMLWWSSNNVEGLIPSFPTFLPQYSVYCCILSLIACGVFLRVSFELKVLFLTVASTAYYIIILSTRRELFVVYGHLLYGQTNNSWTCSRWDSVRKRQSYGLFWRGTRIQTLSKLCFSKNKLLQYIKTM